MTTLSLLPPGPIPPGPIQFAGDDSNSTDLIIEFKLETDGQWGPYLFCNPVDSKKPHGPWYCDVSFRSSGPPPPAQCKALNYSLFSKNKWVGLGAKNTSVDNSGACCGIANGKKFNYYDVAKQCETFTLALDNKADNGAVLGYQDNTPPPCNCSRVHKTVGRENLTVTFAGFHSMHPAGGVWFSHPAQGECKEGQYVGDGSGCSWRVVQTSKIIQAKCMYAHMDSNVENHDPSCFSSCAQPHNVTSDCYLSCYDKASKRMTRDERSAPWTSAFASDDPRKGGCPPAENPLDL